MKMETPAEACCALAVLIVGADGVGTTQESRFLFETMAALPMFHELDETRVAELMSDATDWVWSSFPHHGSRMTDEGVSDLLRLICEALPREARAEPFRAAVGLAQSDGVSPEEGLLLERLCDGLEIDPGLAREFLGPDRPKEADLRRAST